MAEHAIPVDLYNPGQVFACMGFLEAADVLLGDAVGGFDWSEPEKVVFQIRADGAVNPVAAVLEFLAAASPQCWVPKSFEDEGTKKDKAAETDEGESEETGADAANDDSGEVEPSA